MVPPPSDLVACAGCGCHAKHTELTCPHCGASLRGADGSVPRAAAALLLGLGAVALGCSSGPFASSPEYGVAITDSDGDGWEDEADCDDANAEIHPEAMETAGDGIDSNCNMDDDT